MVKVMATALAASGLLCIAAPSASADEIDYLDFLDSKGVLYATSLDAVEDGKWVCHNLRASRGVPVTEQFTMQSGYSLIEARTIVWAAASYMCTEQRQMLLDYIARNAPAN